MGAADSPCPRRESVARAVFICLLSAIELPWPVAATDVAQEYPANVANSGSLMRRQVAPVAAQADMGRDSGVWPSPGSPLASGAAVDARGEVASEPGWPDSDLWMYRGVGPHMPDPAQDVAARSPPPPPTLLQARASPPPDPDADLWLYRGVGPPAAADAAPGFEAPIAASLLQADNSSEPADAPGNETGNGSQATAAAADSRSSSSTSGSQASDGAASAAKSPAPQKGAEDAAVGAAAAMGGFALSSTASTNHTSAAQVHAPVLAESSRLSVSKAANHSAPSVRRRRGRSGDPEDNNETFELAAPTLVQEEIDVFTQTGGPGAHARRPGGALQLGGKVDVEKAASNATSIQSALQALARGSLNLSGRDLFKLAVEGKNRTWPMGKRTSIESYAQQLAARKNETQVWHGALSTATFAAADTDSPPLNKVLDSLFQPSSSHMAVVQENTRQADEQAHKRPGGVKVT
eukprot:TRINITY_DN92643_c0_g1_i1.p1 TRINITY_DN92643_c0_g1~~TRINITY_DN92643_c0_g1_i1.p1  ORF type:complete len:465 (+),score=111.40 TRINITY_DN92643_c0_g1_i1:67-1461(+)